MATLDRSDRFRLTRRGLIAGLCTAPALARAADKGEVITGAFDGERPSPFDPASKLKGGQPYRGKSGQTYRKIAARNFGNGLVRISEDVDGLTIEDIEAENFYRLLEGDKVVSLSNFTVRNIKAKGFERGVSRLRGSTNNGLFEDISADSEAQMGDPFPIGFHLSETCHDIIYRRCAVFRCQTPKIDKKYQQGDGFADERGCSKISYIDTLAQECTDGGYDVKSTEISMIRAKAVRNKRNFRLWSDNTLEHIISEDATGAHVSIHGPGHRTIRIERLEITAKFSQPLLHFGTGDGATISIGSYEINAPPGTPLFSHDSTPRSVDWGSQGPPKL